MLPIGRDKLKDKLREIGARFVATCQSCQHGITQPQLGTWSGAVTCRLHHLDLPASAVCNNHLASVGKYAETHCRRHLDTVSTPNRHWIVCQHCAWEGWSRACLDDGYGSWDRCPKCKERAWTE